MSIHLFVLQQWQIFEWSDEKDLIKKIEFINDIIGYKGYSEEEVIQIVNQLVKIDILSLQYAAREQILHTLCDSIANYHIKEKIDIKIIIDIKDIIEDDLKEYIEELLCVQSFK